jgi:predicted ATP-grasp superfamily ATP-dependent carboligase
MIDKLKVEIAELRKDAEGWEEEYKKMAQKNSKKQAIIKELDHEMQVVKE